MTRRTLGRNSLVRRDGQGQTLFRWRLILWPPLMLSHADFQDHYMVSRAKIPSFDAGLAHFHLPVSFGRN